MSESSMALRKARASASSRSAISRLRMSRPSRSKIAINASDMAITNAVKTLGKRSGAPCQLSKRTTSVVPERSSNWCALKTRLARRA